MKKDILFKKIISVVLIVLFIFGCFFPTISGYNKEKNVKTIPDINYDIQNQEELDVTFYSMGLGKSVKEEIKLTQDEFEELFERIEQYAKLSAEDKMSPELECLKEEIINIANVEDLIPVEMYDELFSNTNPSFKSIERSYTLYPLYDSRDSAFFCNFATFGEGSQFPILVLPRLVPILLFPIPRVFLGWRATDAITSCGGMLSGRGFIASGQQNGLALGFWGIGFSVFLPPVMAYGFIGYALFATANAEIMEPWPPNIEPVISSENPSTATWDVPVTLSELSFTIEDGDGDLMSYSVTTDPDIGSDNGVLKPDGTYTVDVDGLEYDTQYFWNVRISDDVETVEKQFSFCTESLPFDPFEEGWSYRKKVTVDHSLVDGDVENFPVLINTVDVDLRDKAQVDGDDILFMDDVGVSKKLHHEFEKYDGSTGDLITWVNVKNLKSDQDTDFYLYYGNMDCDNQEFSERVWDSSSVAVYHMNDDPDSAHVMDSTVNNNDGVKKGSNEPMESSEGKILNCQHYDGSDDIINFGAPREDIYTFDIWIKPDVPIDYGLNQMCLAEYTYQEFRLVLGSHYASISIQDVIPPDPRTNVEYCSISTDWHLITIVWNDNDNYYNIYFDGVKKPVSNINGHVSLMDCDYFKIGGIFTSPDYYDGFVDEVRVSRTARDETWIKTSFNNQNNPSSFTDFGPEET